MMDNEAVWCFVFSTAMRCQALTGSFKVDEAEWQLRGKGHLPANTASKRCLERFFFKWVLFCSISTTFFSKKSSNKIFMLVENKAPRKQTSESQHQFSRDPGSPNTASKKLAVSEATEPILWPLQFCSQSTEQQWELQLLLSFILIKCHHTVLSAPLFSTLDWQQEAGSHTTAPCSFIWHHWSLQQVTSILKDHQCSLKESYSTCCVIEPW